MYKITSIFLVLVIFTGCVEVPDGTLGIKKQFGKIADEPLSPGSYAYLPIVSEIEIWNVKTQQIEKQLELKSKEGLNVRLSARILYRPTDIVLLRKQVGASFAKKMIIPELSRVLGEIFRNNSAEEITKNYVYLASDAKYSLKTIMARRGVEIEKLSVDGLVFP